MARCYLSYRLKLEEPLIVGNGSQIGNVLQTQDHIPGSSMLGVCAGLYIRKGNKPQDDKGGYSDEFRSLFLSEQTIFSPSYPLAGGYESFPMPLSVLGCKYYGFQEPKGRDPDMHGFTDFLYRDIPDQCLVDNCRAGLEHKRGFCYPTDDRHGYCNHDVDRQILSHNQVSEEPEDKRLFSFESLAEGQQFHGEISFSDEGHREIIYRLLSEYPVVKIGKARNRGYGRVRIFSPRPTDKSVRDDLGDPNPSDRHFSIYLYSDAILMDRKLNYRTSIDEEDLAFQLRLKSANGLKVYLKPEGDLKSFYTDSVVLGFNQHRKMPLPMEKTISKGSVFTVQYNGDNKEIKTKLDELQANGMGLRRNEGFGMVVVNHKIHGQRSDGRRKDDE